LNVQVPLLSKEVVNSLSVDIAAQSTVWVLAGSPILGCTGHNCPCYGHIYMVYSKDYVVEVNDHGYSLYAHTLTPVYSELISAARRTRRTTKPPASPSIH
jgi:hypothetical protein